MREPVGINALADRKQAAPDDGDQIDQGEQRQSGQQDKLVAECSAHSERPPVAARSQIQHGDHAGDDDPCEYARGGGFSNVQHAKAELIGVQRDELPCLVSTNLVRCDKTAGRVGFVRQDRD